MKDNFNYKIHAYCMLVIDFVLIGLLLYLTFSGFNGSIVIHEREISLMLFANIILSMHMIIFAISNYRISKHKKYIALILLSLIYVISAFFR